MMQEILNIPHLKRPFMDFSWNIISCIKASKKFELKKMLRPALNICPKRFISKWSALSTGVNAPRSDSAPITQDHIPRWSGKHVATLFGSVNANASWASY